MYIFYPNTAAESEEIIDKLTHYYTIFNHKCGFKNKICDSTQYEKMFRESGIKYIICFLNGFHIMYNLAMTNFTSSANVKRCLSTIKLLHPDFEMWDTFVFNHTRNYNHIIQHLISSDPLTLKEWPSGSHKVLLLDYMFNIINHDSDDLKNAVFFEVKTHRRMYMAASRENPIIKYII